MAKTAWWCDGCHASGVMTHEERASVYDVIEALRTRHEGHELSMWGNCRGLSHVRVQELKKPQADGAGGQPVDKPTLPRA